MITKPGLNKAVSFNVTILGSSVVPW